MSIRKPQVVPINLAAGEATSPLAFGGARIFVDTTNHDSFEVAIDGSDFLPIGLGKNIFTDEEFKRVQFRNPNGTALVAVVVVGFWTYDDKRFHVVGSGAPVVVANEDSDPVPVIDATPETIVASAALTVAAGNYQDVAANADRVLLVIYNSHATDTLWWQAVGDTTTKGVPIRANMIWSIAHKGEFRLRNPGANAIDAYITEQEL